MAFSGALTLTDLNDFITPAQACIKPVEQANAPPKTEQVKEPGAASTEILIDSTGAYYEVSSNNTTTLETPSSSSNNKLPQAQISLNDCLACSGCITSAESVLITLQSHTEVLNALAENALVEPPSVRKIPVVSIAPQSLASLAAALSSSSASSSSTSTPPPQVTPRQVLRRVQVFCREVLGFAHVFDTNFGRELALREHVAEFEERRAAAAATKASTSGSSSEQHLPMLASACPGWICYAEKAHAEMLPFISRTKSPQQVMGTLVKSWMAKKWGKTPDGVYHVTVMPCYDKKLEASRKDFYDEVYATRDVDCVITTGELELLMREKGWDLSVPVPGELDPPPYPSRSLSDPKDSTSIILPELPQHPGTSSGSYLHGIINHLRDTSPTPLTLTVKMIRNADYEEYTLTDGERVVFRGAKCYGFRNLQNIVRKVGRERGVRTGAGAAGRLGGGGRAAGGAGGGIARRLAGRKAAAGGGDGEETKYEYVEVMACPGGCVNGGGQLKGGKVRDEESYERDWSESGVKWGDKEWTKRVEEVYWSDGLDGAVQPPSAASYALLEEIRREVPSDALRTDYRAVESEVIGLAVKW